MASLFVVFLYCVQIIASGRLSLSALILPSVWLVLGLCLLSTRKTWLYVAAMLPLLLLTLQGAWKPLPLDDLKRLLQVLVCQTLPAVGLAVLWFILLLCAIHTGWKIRRKIWLLPILLVLPWCIWQYGNTMPWAQLGMVASMTLWLKPSGR